MTSNRFIYLILSAFIAGNLLIIFMQYNSANNIHSLIIGNKKLLNELKVGNKLRELERDLLSSEIKLERAVAIDDTSRLGEVDFQIADAQSLLDSMRKINDQDSTRREIDRLSELAGEKLALKKRILDSFRHSGKLSSNDFKAIMQHRRLSNEVNITTRKIYTSRQRLLDSLSISINNSGQKAQRWSIIMISMVLVSGAALFWYVISRIRHQNLLIQQLDASEKKVREVSLIKENFMANMSHEIRTPMNAILGFTNLLKAKTRDPELMEFVDAIRSSGATLLAIINDILDLSKIEAGMMRIEPTPFSVQELIHSLQTMFAEKMKEKGLHFSITIDETIPDTLSGDAVRLTQVLVNIIGNAVKFTSEGSIQVTVNNKGIDGNHIRLGFVIQDTGIGIAKEKLSGIFERFRQAEDSITRHYGGTGLGLSIAKDLISLQKGEIEVESEPGKGTTFRFTIPYEIAAGQLVLSTLPESIASGHPDSRHLRILVVEDNIMNQSLLRHLLTSWRFSFEMANNGMTAIEKLQTGRFDLVLMDVQMPGMDGYTAAQEIRMKLKLDIPIIAMTAHAFAGEREKCLGYGMNEYLAKPLDERELFRLIMQFTGIHKSPPASGKAATGEVPAVYQTIDLQYMRGISEGDKEYERAVTQQFLEVIPLDIAALESALASKDLPSLRQTAHSMRTDIAIMGLLGKLQSVLDVLEYEIFEEERFAEAISSVKAICQEALPEARHFYTTLDQADTPPR
ncbi:MAG TPA: ATP-binding protein [Puia sp.]|nr:ATP-binding protein [Puia sp.]